MRIPISNKNYIKKNVISGSFKTLLSLALTLLLTPYIINKIGLESFGLVSVVLIFSGFTGFFDLGLSKSYILFSKNAFENKNKLQSIVFINYTLALIVISINVILSIFEVNIFGNKLTSNVTILKNLNFIALTLLALEIINNLLRANLESSFKLQYINYGHLIYSIVLNISWAILSFYQSPLVLFLYSPILASIATIVFHLSKIKSQTLIPIFPDKYTFRSVYCTSLQFLKIGFLNSIHLPMIKYFITFFCSPMAIGIFELSTKLGLMITNTFSYFTNPIFTISNQENDKKTLIRLTFKLTSILIILFVLGYAFFFIFHQEIIIFFFNTYTNEIFKVFNLVIIGLSCLAMTDGIQKLYMGLGNLKILFITKLYSVVLNVFLLIYIYLVGLQSLLITTYTFSISLILLSIFWIYKLTLLKKNGI